MGACMSSSGQGGVEVTESDKLLHQQAEKAMKEAKAKLAIQHKLLLLGTGDSGKSTVLKQMRLIHKVPFTPNEIEGYRQTVFDNITRGFKDLLEAMEDMKLEVSESNRQYIPLFEDIPDLKGGDTMPQEYKQALQELWADPAVQQAWDRRAEAAVHDNLSYFLSSPERLFAPGFEPSEQDIVQCRVRTTGIHETVFKLKGQELLMVDVGGQRSERRKWIHCFQEVTAILFLISLSGYDQGIIEDREANQMKDAMVIWDSITHSQWFKNTKLILFLNKNDLFEAKVPQSDVKRHFPEYAGDSADPNAVREFFKSRLLQLVEVKKRADIYTHVTTATNTQMLRVVMAAVEDIVIRGNLEDMGVL